MSARFLKVHPDDDMLVALTDHAAGEVIQYNGHGLTLPTPVTAKHKFASRSIVQGELLRMYGITVARALADIAPGEVLTTRNITHATGVVTSRDERRAWTAPDVSQWRDASFMGYPRGNGQVGTGNYWLVIPMVFCENHNLDTMRDAMLEELGYKVQHSYQTQTSQLIEMLCDGKSISDLLQAQLATATEARRERFFPNVDGLKFLRHEGGCGGTYEDADSLCGLFAGYITHPNVAGATVLSLGCQKSTLQRLKDEIHRRDPEFSKPLLMFEQQRLPSQEAMMSHAIKHTFVGLMGANEIVREPAPLEHLTIGVECGGSDGFSGLSANPAIGHCSDLIVGLGGSVILSEFPELAGCEQELTDRCVDQQVADRFLDIMRTYEYRAGITGGSFETNPSPGNIQDGLITDAIKSAGAAKKGGTSPVVDAFDYPESATKKGLNLLCTPGGDVESTTAMAGAGANVMLFSTGLGTPTGNPVAPVIKVSSNTDLFERLPDIIDLNAGEVITGDETIEQVGQRMLEMVIETASGRYTTRAQSLGQDDFIPWKRGLTL